MEEWAMGARVLLRCVGGGHFAGGWAAGGRPCAVLHVGCGCVRGRAWGVGVGGGAWGVGRGAWVSTAGGTR